LANFVTQGQNGGCQAGDFVFSNFLYEFQSSTTVGPVTSPDATTNVLVQINTLTSGLDGSGTTATTNNPIVQVITDFSNSFGGDSSAAITDDQTFNLQVQYTVSLAPTAPTNVYLGQMDGSGMAGLDQTAGDATGDYLKDLCTGAAFHSSGSPGNNTSLNGHCNAGNSADTSVADATFEDAGQPVTDPSNWDTEGGTADSLNMTSFGVHDEIDLNGGDIDTGDNTAAAGTMENDLVEDFSSLGSGTPEPGTFMLLGGALLGLGVIRRKKSA